MTGEVDLRGTPVLRMTIGGREWIAVIDTGFDGELELPAALATEFGNTRVGQSQTTLGGGTVIMEDLFEVVFPFDGEMVQAQAAFALVDEILIGTGLLLNYRLHVNFVERTVVLERVSRH
jgi:predicted aspartyl protease